MRLPSSLPSLPPAWRAPVVLGVSIGGGLTVGLGVVWFIARGNDVPPLAPSSAPLAAAVVSGASTAPTVPLALSGETLPATALPAPTASSLGQPSLDDEDEDAPAASARPSRATPTSGDTTAPPGDGLVAAAGPKLAGDAAPPPPPLNVSEPVAIATVVAATVYKQPNTEAKRLGYLRIGNVVRREADAVTGGGDCKRFYKLRPLGFVCSDDVTTKADDPLALATRTRARLDRPLPYQYGFVRATAPQYLRVPSKEEQLRSEMALPEHLAWYEQHRDEVQTIDLGANDVPLDEHGVPKPGLSHAAGFRFSTQLSQNELFGGSGDDRIPWWLAGGRKIPNVSGFKVPPSSIFTDRVRRFTGLSFVGSFLAKESGFERRFGVTVDLRLVPTTKVKPDSGSPFHGVELGPDTKLPFAFVLRRDVTAFKLVKGKDEAKPAEPLPRRAILPLSGKLRIKAGRRFYQTGRDKTRWLSAADVGVVMTPKEWPEFAEKGEKWIDVSLVQQTLVLYQGKTPVYATLVSTGRDRLGDPKKSLATPQGTFRLRSKHVSAAMDAQENSSVSGGSRGVKRSLDPAAQATVDRLKKAVEAGQSLSAEDQRRWKNVEKGRHPEYGVTLRRGFTDFELRDVPWIQYFASGYALHGAYWHDVFGIPRSHGCVNLAPIDARRVFLWTTPAVPEGWHGVNVGEETGPGTGVYIHE